jgi:hypothetical protein
MLKQKAIAAKLAGAALLWLAVSGPAAAVDTYYMLVFSGPTAPSQDKEYNRWYSQEHAPDVVAVPGFVSAQRFVVNERQLGTGTKTAPLPKYLVLFKIQTANVKSVMAEVGRRVQAGETKISPVFDRDHASAYIYRAIGPRVLHPGKSSQRASGNMHEYVHFVFTVPVAGKEAEFNQWYDQTHAPEMAALPGFVSAQRLEYQQGESRAVPPTHYAALFEIWTDDLSAASRAMSKGMGKPPAGGVPIDPQATRGYTYRAIGPVIYGHDVRRIRAQPAAGNATPR